MPTPPALLVGTNVTISCRCGYVISTGCTLPRLFWLTSQPFVLFGLCNAPATYLSLMEWVLDVLHWKTAIVCLQDIMCGRTFEEELERIDEVFHRFRRVNLKLNPKKCWTCGKQWKGEDWPWKGGCCEDMARTEKTRMCEASLDSALDSIDPWRPLPALPYLSISFVVKE